MSEQSKAVRTNNDEGERRAHNRKLALAYGALGIAVFPTFDKIPMPQMWQFLDKHISPEDRAEHIDAKLKNENKDISNEPFFGSTTDAATIRAMWNYYPDATPSISLGPSRLSVMDMDTSRDVTNPAKARAWLIENGFTDFARCPVTVTRDGGFHLYFRDDDRLFSRVPPIMDSMHVQLKASGGQTVAPGAWRDDGKRYVPLAGHPTLGSLYGSDEMLGVPECLKVLQTAAAATASVGGAEGLIVAEIKGATPLEFEDATDPCIGLDIAELAGSNTKFAKLWSEPGDDDYSANRMSLANHLVLAFFEQLTPALWFAIVTNWGGAGIFVGDAKPSQGEFNYRAVARDLIRARADNAKKGPTTASSFGAVEDEDDPNDPAVLAFLERRAAHDERKLAKLAGSIEGESTQHEPPAKADATRLKSINSDELISGYVPTTWSFKGLVPFDGSIGFLIAPSHVGKTFVAIGLMGHLAQGKAFADHAVDPAGFCSVYITGEGVTGIAGRLKAWTQVHGSVGGRVQVITGIENPVAKPRRCVRQIKAEVEKLVARSGRPCALIILDTIASLCPGHDDNDTTAVGVLTEFMRELGAATGAAILGVHHEGKDGSRGARGSSAYFANPDFSFSIDNKTLGPSGTINVTKQRDGARRSQGISFKLDTVVIGNDADGDDVTSLAFRIPPKGDAMGAVVDDDDDLADDPAALATEGENGGSMAERRAADMLATAQRLPASGFTRAELTEAFNAPRRKVERLAETAMLQAIASLKERGALISTGKGRLVRYKVALKAPGERPAVSTADADGERLDVA